MIATIELKIYMAGACILCIVICKLSHWQEPGPIILLEINKNLELDLHIAVLPLCLAIYLGVKSGREPLFYIKEIAK